MKNHFIISVFVALTISACMSSCKDDPEIINGEKGFVNYSFLSAHNIGNGLTADVYGVINEADKTIVLDIQEENVNISSLVASFEIMSDNSVQIRNTFQESGSTKNNFLSDLMYTVTALDGTEAIYTVHVNYIKSNACDLLNMKLEAKNNSALESDYPGVIENDKVAFLLPSVDITSLKMTFAVSQRATLEIAGVAQTSGVSAVDYTDKVMVRVVAENGTDYKEYEVTVVSENVRSFTITSEADIPESFAGLTAINNLIFSGGGVTQPIFDAVVDKVGDLEIRGNIELNRTVIGDFQAIKKLNIVGGYVFMAGNDNLWNDGFDVLTGKTVINGDLVLEMMSWIWLEWQPYVISIKTVGGHFRYLGGPFGINGKAFAALRDVGGDFELANLNGGAGGTWDLSAMNMNSIGGDLIIKNFLNLWSLQGLHNITHIGGNITLELPAGFGFKSENGCPLIKKWLEDGVVSPDATISITDVDGGIYDLTGEKIN